MAALLACMGVPQARPAGRSGQNVRSQSVRRKDRDAGTTYRFFDVDEAAFIEAAVERLIPADQAGPGARHAGVSLFIDRQMTGAWDAGSRQYRRSLWHAGQQHDDYRLPGTPGELFRSALRGIETDMQRQSSMALQVRAEQRDGGFPKRANSGISPRADRRDSAAERQAHSLRDFPRGGAHASALRQFADLPAGEQDRYIKSLRAGRKHLEGVPSQLFFEILFALTIEGFFSDPVYSGNEDGVAFVAGSHGSARG